MYNIDLRPRSHEWKGSLQHTKGSNPIKRSTLGLQQIVPQVITQSPQSIVH